MTGYRETYRRAVSAEMCGLYGHMNVQFYVAAISDSFISLATELGLGKSAAEKHRVGLIVVNMNINYLAEVHEGRVIRMESAIISVEGKKLKVRHKLYDLASGKQAMEATVLHLCMDLDARQSIVIPEDFMESIQEAIVVEK
ncbi:MAG: thioesterase family protein [Alphaproteobacteria bacterium]|nr:thioesterase family protein [Rhodospirillales bacterium]MCW9044975.1 thioesterase family protein [Alphaproteobacteria bacterium]